MAVTQEQRGMSVPSKVEKISEEASTAERDNEGTLGTSVDFGELKENVLVQRCWRTVRGGF